jgi:hypothetical protein
VSAENSVWSEKILFGTDYSFLSVQATELILYLLSRRFSGGPRDIQNILGGNALKIITRPVLTYRKTDLASQQIICKDKEQKTTSVALSTITHLFEKGWDLTSTDYLPISGNGWPVPIQLQGREFSGINFEVQVLSFRHEETDRELVIWITPNKNNHISLNIHGSGPFPSLMTLAETSTSSNNLALRGFYDNSQPAKNAKIMLSKLDNILKS